MKETETASIHNIRRAEIFTSRQAIQMEMAVTNRARNGRRRRDRLRHAARGLRSDRNRRLRWSLWRYTRGEGSKQLWRRGTEEESSRRRCRASPAMRSNGQICRYIGRRGELRPLPGRRRARCRCPQERRLAGMVATGVVVGAMVETDCARVSIGERTSRRNP